jgi:replication factor C subunit 2/4
VCYPPSILYILSAACHPPTSYLLPPTSYLLPPTSYLLPPIIYLLPTCRGYPCPKFKIIVLDEVDTMTPDAQSALRRIIEAYSKVTRFCLICNYVTRVIEPLASRCAKFRFKPLPVESMQMRMRQIASSESVGLSEETLSVLLRASKGDMRKAVTYLQSAFQLTPSGDIDPLTVIDISGQVAQEVMDKMWGVMAGRNVDALRGAVDEMLYSGFALADILSQLHDEVVGREGLSDVDKALICEKIAEVRAKGEGRRATHTTPRNKGCASFTSYF